MSLQPRISCHNWRPPSETGAADVSIRLIRHKAGSSVPSCGPFSKLADFLRCVASLSLSLGSARLAATIFRASSLPRRTPIESMQALFVCTNRHSAGCAALFGSRAPIRLSKMGNPALRSLLVVGATAVLRHARGNPNASKWITALLARRPYRIVAVALANKMARIVWALLVRGGTYQDTGTRNQIV